MRANPAPARGALIATLLETSLVGHGGTFAISLAENADPSWIDGELRARAPELLAGCQGVGPQSRLLLSLHHVRAATCRMACTWLLLRNAHDHDQLAAMIARELVYLACDLERPADAPANYAGTNVQAVHA